MGFSKYYLLVAIATILLVDQSDASKISEKITNLFPDAKEKFDIKSDIGGDGNIVIAMAQDAIKKIHQQSEKYTHLGDHFGEFIAVFVEGIEKTLKLVADSMDEAFDLIDNLVDRDIKNKTAAISTINNGMNDVRSSIYRSSVPAHSCLGAGKSMANITDKGEYKHAIETIEETATVMFDNLESAQTFAIQGIKAHGTDVTKKCLQAAHAAILSAVETVITNFIAASKSVCDYLASSDKATIVQHDPTEKLISDKAKEAAAADSDTVAAMEGLNKEFENAIEMGISASILNDVKEGLEEYIEHCAWSVSTCYHALAEAKQIAKSDPQAANRAIEDAVKTAKLILMDGSVKAYEVLGEAGLKIGSLDKFQDAIEIAERSRVEGTKGFESAQIVAKSGINTGGRAAEHACDASHKILEANEALIFDYIHELRHIVFNVMKPDGQALHAEH